MRLRTLGWLAGYFALVATLGICQRACEDEAHATEPPPLIGQVRQVVRDATRRIDDDARAVMPDRHAQRADGPMCTAPLELGGDEQITESERVLVERQIGRCVRRPGRRADPFGLLSLVRLEDALDVPDESRGILAAVWCIEGAMRSDKALRGDPRMGVAQAHGPFQLWPWHRAWCGLTEAGADDLETAARCYWARVEDRRQVRAMECADSWRVGEALTANGVAYLPFGCAAESSHWREAMSWMSWRAP